MKNKLNLMIFVLFVIASCSLVIAQEASNYSYEIEFVSEVLFDGERGIEQEKEFTITNIGNGTLENINLDLSLESDENMSIRLDSASYSDALSTFSLEPGFSQNIFVKTYISLSEKTTRTKVAELSISADKIDPVKTLFYKQAPSKLQILSIEVDDEDDEYFVSNLDRVDDIKPESKLEFTIELENLYEDEDNERQEIRNIDVDIRVIDILNDGKKDIHEDAKSFDLDPTETEEETLEFDIPLEVNEKSSGYKVEVTASGKDRYGTKHEDEWELILLIEKEDHDIRIIKSELEPSEISCDIKSTYLDTKIQNFGGKEEEDVIIEIINHDLRINKRYGFIPDLETDVFDEDSEFAHSFYLEIPKGTKIKSYPLIINVIDDDDDVSDTRTINLDVKGCVQQKQEKLPVSAYEQALKQAEEQVSQQFVPKETIKSSGSHDSWKTALLISGAVILLGIVIFMIMAVVIKGKKRRKY